MYYTTYSSKTSKNIGKGLNIVKNKFYELWNIVLKRNAYTHEYPQFDSKTEVILRVSIWFNFITNTFLQLQWVGEVK